MLLSADYRIGTAGNFKLGLNEVAIGMTMPYFGVELARARLDPAHFELSVSCAHLYDADGAVDTRDSCPYLPNDQSQNSDAGIK